MLLLGFNSAAGFSNPGLGVHNFQAACKDGRACSVMQTATGMLATRQQAQRLKPESNSRLVSPIVDSPHRCLKGSGKQHLQETEAIQCMQRGLLWAEKRTAIAEHFGRNISDEEFAAELGLAGGAAEYKREVRHFRESKRLLTASNMNIVKAVARDLSIAHYTHGLDMSDLIQYGIVGLHKAMQRFDIKKGVPFSAYAPWWIRKSIQDGSFAHARQIRLPRRVYYDIQELRRAKHHIMRQKGRPASKAELAEYMGISLRRLETIMHAKNLEVKSMHEAVRDEWGASDAGHEEQSNEGKYQDHVMRSLLQQLSDQTTLSSRQSSILRMLYGFDASSLTSEEVSRQLKITQTTVRRHKSNAIRKLRTCLAKQILASNTVVFKAGTRPSSLKSGRLSRADGFEGQRRPTSASLSKLIHRKNDRNTLELSWRSDYDYSTGELTFHWRMKRGIRRASEEISAVR